MRDWFVTSDGNVVVDIGEVSSVWVATSGKFYIWFRGERGAHSERDHMVVDKRHAVELMNELARRKRETPLR